MKHLRFALAVVVSLGLLLGFPAEVLVQQAHAAATSEPGSADGDGGVAFAKNDHDKGKGRKQKDDDDDDGPGRGRAPDRLWVSGIVTDKGDTSFTIVHNSGTIFTIEVNGRTRYKQVGSGRNKPSFASVKVGMKVSVRAQDNGSDGAWLAQRVELPRAMRLFAHHIGEITALSDTSITVRDRMLDTHTSLLTSSTRKLPTGATFAVGDRVLIHARWNDDAGDDGAWETMLLVKLGPPADGTTPPPPSDTTAPTVTGVSSTTADGSYGVGAVINVTVSFSEAVTVTGAPQLTLETGAADAVAPYFSGSGTSTLTFRYLVAAGHSTGDLDYTSTSALALNGGTIKDSTGNDAALALAAPGAAGSLGAAKAIVINTSGADTTPPAVTSVSSTNADGSYGAGAVIAVTVTFSEPVVVTGTPQLTLETGATDAVVNYSSGSGTSTLTFNYTVAAGHTSADLDYTSTAALVLNGGTIKDGAGNNAALGLAAPGSPGSLGANKNLVITAGGDATVPTVTGVSSTNADGSYGAGAVINVTVSFSEAVTVTGTPQLTLETGAADAVAPYFSGSGTSTLTFRYAVASGHSTGDLDYTSTTALALNGGTIRDAASNDAVLTLAAPGAAGSLGASKNIVIDTTGPDVTAPAVLSVSSTTADGSYAAGAVIAITVTFSEAVTVTGTPQLTLETGATDAVVGYSSGSGASTLTFNYTVAAGHTSADLDYTATTALALNGGTIRDAASNDAVLTLAAPGAAGSLGASKAIVITAGGDTTAPTVTGVSSTTANGSYNAGDVIAVTVTFSEAVTVTGTPQLTLETGATDAVVNYSSGSGTSTLTFNYTVAAGHTSADLDYTATTALALNGGTIRDAASNDAVLTLAAPGAAGSLGASKAIVVDTTAPTVTGVSSTTADGSYNAGDVIAVTVTFSEAVTVTGTPQLTLETGATDAVVGYSSGSGTSTLTFNYTVAAGHASADLDYTATTALALNGGTIKDSAGNDAVLTLAAPGAAGSLGASKAIVVDTTAPTVTGVSSTTADGSYAAGAVIAITVTFSEAVTVTGTPQLTLETGATDAVVGYSSGSGTSTLTFNYTVAAGHTSADLDYTATTALALNGGTIKDSAGNDAVLTLAAPGAAGSLGASKAIVVTG